MTSKTECFVKRTADGYNQMVEVVSRFKPDFSKEFGFKCTFASVVGTFFLMIATVNPTPNMGWVVPAVLALLTCIPVAIYPIYRAFGICYCGAES